MKCSGYSATVEEDESKYYLIEKINKILIFWYSFELHAQPKMVVHCSSRAKNFINDSTTATLIFKFVVQKIAI